jgi:hypothetical protein
MSEILSNIYQTAQSVWAEHAGAIVSVVVLFIFIWNLFLGNQIRSAVSSAFHSVERPAEVVQDFEERKQKVFCRVHWKLEPKSPFCVVVLIKINS